MAVFTTLNEKELENVLKDFQLGDLVDINGIAQGTVNSNFELKTSRGHFVLTVLEAMKPSLANQLLSYLDFCASKKFPCPVPSQTNQKKWLVPLKDKWVTVCAFLPGTMASSSTPALCFQMGKTLGQLHLAGQGYPHQPANQMGFTWQNEAFQTLQASLSPSDLQAIQQALEGQKIITQNHCPKGMIHFDCFMDNVLVQNNQMTGVLDFFYACFDYLILDIAITINDWCCPQSRLNLEYSTAFIKGYQTIRSLTVAEWQSLKSALILMAAHYWMSRHLTQLEKKQGFGDFNKDPFPFKKLCLNLQNETMVDGLQNALCR